MCKVEEGRSPKGCAPGWNVHSGCPGKMMVVRCPRKSPKYSAQEKDAGESWSAADGLDVHLECC